MRKLFLGALAFILFSIIIINIVPIGYFNRGGNPRVYACRGNFTSLKSNLDLYKMNGLKGYPTTEQGLQALVEKPTTEPIPEDWIQMLKPVKLLDPWGNPYTYYFPGTKNPNKPEIISSGPDGVFGNDDDLSSQD